ncbi:MAG: PTS sugar transporter subunit IIA [Candidatus Krumholzibacteriota bacterium]|nr:PTS sugar transporter subunit IIA [Candidatus Krumholzibacteriota bacterium]
MRFLDFIRPECINTDLDGEDKGEIIEELVQLMGESNPEADTDRIYEAVMARERDGSTGLELGVAIPHAKCDAVGKLSIVIGISRNGVDFDSLDGNPAHLFFLMIAPTSESGPHVQAIAKIVKMIKIDSFRKQLLKASGSEDIIKAIRKVEEGDE